MKTNKLRVRKETLRSLSDADLSAAGGGTIEAGIFFFVAVVPFTIALTKWATQQGHRYRR